jgi:hypothetical protein
VQLGRPLLLPAEKLDGQSGGEADSDEEFQEETTVEQVSDAALLASSVLASYLAKDPIRVRPFICTGSHTATFGRS